MWLKRIFGKKDDVNSSPAPQARSARTFSETRKLLDERLAADEAVALKSCESLRSALMRSMTDLKAVINALAAADVPEPTATASKVIKDGFAQRALAALSRIDIPEWDTIAGLQENLSLIERTLAAVSVGPREAMHVKFFFEEQMAAIAALLHTIFDIVKEIRRRLESSEKRRKEAEDAVHALEACEYAIVGKGKDIMQAEFDIKAAKEELSAIRFNDLAELLRLRNELSKLKHAADEVDQQVVSQLSPATKLLKRFAYSADKHTADFMRNIEDSPATTLYAGEERVKSIIASALAAVRSGQVSADEKEVRRTEYVLDHFDDLTALCERRHELETRISELRALSEQEEAKERENAAAEAHMQSLENAVAEGEMQVTMLKHEIEEARQRLGPLKRELSALATEILGEQVEIC